MAKRVSTKKTATKASKEAKASAKAKTPEAAAKPKKTAAKAKSKKKAKAEEEQQGGALLGFEKKLWEAADKLRGSMDSGEYKHVVLGLIFLKYISDSFEQKFNELTADEYSDAEDRDEYMAENIFWVPKKARWSNLKVNAKKPEIGVMIDDAMEAIEKENQSLKGTLPKQYARPALDKRRLGELIDLMSDIGLVDTGHDARDLLGRIYEYFLSRFASAEGKNGGEFYTPQSIVRVLVEMLEPYKGRVYDPCCGSGGMFVQSEKFAEAHGGRIGDIAVYGQEANATTWRLCKMNMAIRGIDANLGPEWADTFHNDAHKSLKADYILANPPFNIKDWGQEHVVDDVRWKYGVPPSGNANFAWLQHMVHHLGPNGTAGIVLANGSMSSTTSGEGDIREALLEADLVDCMVALPGQLFYSTPIPVCLWFLARNKTGGKLRTRKGEVLFIDARKMGHLVDRTHREFTNDDISTITGKYHAWRGESEAGVYLDVPGFCKSVEIEDVRKHGHALTPGRYVGSEKLDESGEPFEVRFPRLVAELEAQFANSTRLGKNISTNLRNVKS